MKNVLIYLFSVLVIERSVNIGRDITIKPIGVVDIHLRSQEHSPMSRRVLDKCPDLFFHIFEIEVLIWKGFW